MAGQERHLAGVLEHVERRGALAGEHHQGAVADGVLLKAVEDAPHVQVNGSDRREVALAHVAVAKAVGGEPVGPRVRLLLRAGVERTVVVAVDDRLGVARPRAVRGGVMHAQVERRRIADVAVDERQGIVGDHVGHVAGAVEQFAVADHRRVVVFAAPFSCTNQWLNPCCGRTLLPRCHLPLMPQVQPACASRSV